jgi:hypothetical protein
MLWWIVNTLEYINAINKLLLLLSAAGYFSSVIEGGAEGEITKYLHSCHKVFRSWKEAEGFIEEYRITTGLVKRESHDGDIGTVLDDMMSQLRLG